MKTNRRTFLQGAGVAAGASVLGFPNIVRAQPAEYLVAASVPLTGPNATAGNLALPALTDFQDQVNAAGGIGGVPIRAVAEDSGGNPQNALANYQRAATEENLAFYYGDSTGFMKLVGPELNETKRVMMGGTSFSSTLADPENNPFQYISGPTYQDQFDILLRFIADNGGGTLALIHADTDFGRDPIAHAKQAAAQLGIDIVLQVETKTAGAEIPTHVAQLASARPQWCILHGYVTTTWPQIIGGARLVGLPTRFMGTFWGMEKVIADRVTEQAGAPILEGYMGVMPYRYFYEAADAPAYQKLFALKKAQDPDFPGYLFTWYLQVTMTLELWKKSMEDTIEQDREINAENLMAALRGIQGWDSGGYFGSPVSIQDHKIPQGRVYQYGSESGLFTPSSDWITV